MCNVIGIEVWPIDTFRKLSEHVPLQFLKVLKIEASRSVIGALKPLMRLYCSTVMTALYERAEHCAPGEFSHILVPSYKIYVVRVFTRFSDYSAAAHWTLQIVVILELGSVTPCTQFKYCRLSNRATVTRHIFCDHICTNYLRYTEYCPWVQFFNGSAGLQQAGG